MKSVSRGSSEDEKKLLGEEGRRASAAISMAAKMPVFVSLHCLHVRLRTERQRWRGIIYLRRGKGSL